MEDKCLRDLSNERHRNKTDLMKEKKLQRIEKEGNDAMEEFSRIVDEEEERTNKSQTKRKNASCKI